GVLRGGRHVPSRRVGAEARERDEEGRPSPGQGSLPREHRGHSSRPRQREGVVDVVPLTEEQKRTRAETRRRNEALRAEADAHRQEAKRREWYEKDMFLTREQAAGGEPCRGCGLPVIDGLGSFPPLMH